VDSDFNALMRENLLAFSTKAFKAMNSNNMPNDRYLELLADRLARVAVRKTKRLIVNLPPRHYKTWIGSVCLSAWILGREPSAKILIVTYRRRKGELLMPHAFCQRDIERLQAARRPGFATLQQQDPGGTRLRIKAEHFPTFAPAAVPMSESGIVLSIDPGQKGGAAHSYSVIQAWLHVCGKHFLLRQWREQATYPDLRSAVHKMIARYNPSVVLIEDTNQGPALLCEIRPRPGMMVHPVTPTGDKIERVRRHLATIRTGCIQVPWDAQWRESYVAELTLFPGAGYDDQVDATMQYLDWIAKNPAPPKRERGALATVTHSTGHTVFSSQRVPTIQTRGGVANYYGRRRW
jgi:predicted phage terminase large subunit-like protein